MDSRQQDIYDARTLGKVKFTLLGIQHVFAMFGATVLVPLITGLDITATLLFAGVGTLIFHCTSKFKVPAFLGSSFAFLAGYASVKQIGMEHGMAGEMALNYACIGVAAASMMYFVIAGLLKLFGTEKVMHFFPPVVTGPVVIAIGFTLSGSAIGNCMQDWSLAIVAIIVVIFSSIWGRGIIKIVPILLGVIASFVLAACMGDVDFANISDAAWIGMPIDMHHTAFAAFADGNNDMMIESIIAVLPIVFATIMEHIADVCAIQSTVGRNFIKDPGLHRTLPGDGLATLLASLFGAPANTTYGENTGVLNLTRVFDPAVIRLAAVFAILISFSPKFACLIALIPTATVGGISLILYGMISAVGVRNMVEQNVDFSSSRNIFVAVIILVISIGVQYGTDSHSVSIGPVSFSGLAMAAIIGIIINAILHDEHGIKFEAK